MYYKRQNKNQWSHSIIRVVVVVAVCASGTVDLVVRSAASTLDGVTERRRKRRGQRPRRLANVRQIVFRLVSSAPSSLEPAVRDPPSQRSAPSRLNQPLQIGCSRSKQRLELTACSRDASYTACVRECVRASKTRRQLTGKGHGGVTTFLCCDKR